MVPATWQVLQGPGGNYGTAILNIVGAYDHLVLFYSLLTTASTGIDYHSYVWVRKREFRDVRSLPPVMLFECWSQEISPGASGQKAHTLPFSTCSLNRCINNFLRGQVNQQAQLIHLGERWTGRILIGYITKLLSLELVELAVKDNQKHNITSNN